MRLKNLLRTGVIALSLLAGSATALPLWELQGTRARIHILGSVHFLRAQDYPLPDVVMSVFDDADVVVFEIDLGNLDPLATQTTLQKLAIDQRGNDLADHLGAQDFRNASSLAAEIDIDMNTLRPYKPWFAALQITQLRMAQLGFDGTWGIETQLTLKAVEDGKEIRGLETLEQQFGALDSLPQRAQNEFLMQTLADAAEIEEGLDRIIRAWRNGDTATLEEELLEGLADQPELYDSILRQRNRDWTRQIAGLTKARRSILVVVGALHLVGDDSVIRMLEEAGYRTKKID